MSKLNNAMNLLPGDLLLIPSCVYNGESDYKVEIGQIIEHLAEVIEKVPARWNVETGEMETKETKANINRVIYINDLLTYKISHRGRRSGGATTCVASLSD